MDSAPKHAALDDEQLVELFHAYALDHDNKAVFRARLDHELRVNRCGDCGTWHEPPKPRSARSAGRRTSCPPR